MRFYIKSTSLVVNLHPAYPLDPWITGWTQFRPGLLIQRSSQDLSSGPISQNTYQWKLLKGWANIFTVYSQGYWTITFDDLVGKVWLNIMYIITANVHSHIQTGRNRTGVDPGSPMRSTKWGRDYAGEISKRSSSHPGRVVKYVQYYYSAGIKLKTKT